MNITVVRNWKKIECTQATNAEPEREPECEAPQEEKLQYKVVMEPLLALAYKIVDKEVFCHLPTIHARHTSTNPCKSINPESITIRYLLDHSS